MKKRSSGKKKEPLYLKTNNKKLTRFIRLLKEDKKFFALFGVSLSLILVIGSTFAWSSYSSWVDNHMQSEIGTLDVRVSEIFDQESVLQPNTPIQKEVDVRNNSEKLALVRVKLLESTALFRIDNQTGSLSIRGKEATDKVIDREFSNTWEKDALFPLDVSKNQYYILNDVTKMEIFKYGDANRKDELKKFELGFVTGLKIQPDISEKNPYWVYEDGYFYYSKVLKGSETTSISLLEKITVLGNNQKNSHKNELYNLDVTAFGINANEKSLENWNVSPSIQLMYEQDELFQK